MSTHLQIFIKELPSERLSGSSLQIIASVFNFISLQNLSPSKHGLTVIYVGYLPRNIDISRTIILIFQKLFHISFCQK